MDELPQNDNARNLPQNAIELRGLFKTYALSTGSEAKIALDHVDLDIPRGSLFGLLGPNGAGKSTLINILAGLTLKTEGEVWVWDADIDEAPLRARSAIGVVPQELNIDTFFTPRELLEFQAGLYGVPSKERRIDQLLEMVELTDMADLPSRALSGGMRRRLMVAKAMVHSPPILVLDEPTAGVDVDLRRTLWDNMRKLNASGTTILLTTHYLEEAQALCNNIAILHQGTIVANDSKENLLKKLDNKKVTITVDRDLRDVPPNLRPHGWQLDGSRKLTLTERPSGASMGQMLLSVQVNGLNVIDIVTKETDLEDVFLQMTKSA